ncbi:MAG: AMP-binding protein [Nocardioides sp.]
MAETAAAIKPDALATLIYTSGTTGRSGGSGLRHQSWVYEARRSASRTSRRAT